MLLSKHLSKTVLISSASIVTLAFVAIAAQTVDWAEIGTKLSGSSETTDLKVSETEPTPAPQETLQDAETPSRVPIQPLPAQPRANSKVRGAPGRPVD